jgi:hypothetical protein
MVQHEAWPWVEQLPVERRAGVIRSPSLVSLSSGTIPIDVKLAPQLMVGELDCGTPEEFNPA